LDLIELEISVCSVSNERWKSFTSIITEEKTNHTVEKVKKIYVKVSQGGNEFFRDSSIEEFTNAVIDREVQG
jgi:uncharacterized protein YaaR (DUF327 family)